MSELRERKEIKEVMAIAEWLGDARMEAEKLKNEIRAGVLDNLLALIEYDYGVSVETKKETDDATRTASSHTIDPPS